MADGNIAAMRDALVAFQRWYEEVRSYVYHSVKLATAVDKMRAALSAPPRNCDRYRTEAEAEAAFDRFCLKARTGECKPWECPLRSNGGKYCYVAWLLSTEGGAG